jgi:hypothetical protein
MENLKENEKIITIIFESGASALYETIDQNTGECNNPKKYNGFKDDMIKEYSKNFINWVNPENELPCKYTDILIVFKERQGITRIGHYSDASKEFFCEDIYYPISDIIAWCYFPIYNEKKS